MTTHFYTASSLDWFIATPEHSLEWLFKQDFDFEGPMAYPEFVKGIGALFMGASTYEWLLSKSLTTLNSCARNVESENSNKNSK